MNRALVVFVAALASGCARTASSAPAPTQELYALGADATPPLVVERQVVAKDGQTWTFQGFVPNEGCRSAMNEKLARFADGWNVSTDAAYDYADFGATPPYRDLLVACGEHRRARVWSTAWMPLRTQVIASTSMPDLDGDGCGDLVIDQKPGSYELRTATGRVVEQ